MQQTIVHETIPEDDDALLTEISTGAPCGVSIDDDPQFLLLLAGLQPKADAQYGDFYEPAESVNWADTGTATRRLLCQCKDIRLLIILMRCRLRLTGAVALKSGLSMLLALLQKWPEDLHPQLFDEEEFVPQLRANAFAELNDNHGILADIRQLRLPKTAEGQISVRELEQACAARPSGPSLPVERIPLLRQQWICSEDTTFRDLSEAQQCAERLVLQIRENLGEDAPDLTGFLSLLTLFTGTNPRTPAVLPESASPAMNIPVTSDLTGDSDVSPATPFGCAVPVISDRQSACARLEEVRLWFREAEPGSPVIPLLTYAERSIGRNFAELVAMYPPEILLLLNDNSGQEI